MKTEEQIREMKEILHKEIDLSMRQGKTIKDVEMQNLHSMLGMIHLILDDERTLIYSEDYKNLYWFINMYKNRFVISSTVDKDRTSDKERKEEGNYFKTKAEAFFVLVKLRTDLIKNKEEIL
ncbi:hypothetical protein [Leptotrichia hofstadii]|uniref:Uncharacterized protein n=1 Tax=Leptotrichia hofstadii F0254 TaxID=634994 RepID=C9MV47_9FUSO|nr:hypothetical protein [Leptotrichia hofstadii]EEX75269.1 hypothetical protein GCWU000323_00518 [Leptotrichia hofstadii F0254]